MSILHTPSRVIAAVAIASVVLIGSASSASAHAGLHSSTPKNGAQLATAPAAVTLRFEEKVRLDGNATRLVNENGKTVPSQAVAEAKKVTITPKSPLPAGRYAATWHVISTDGDAVEGAISFTVATPNPVGPQVSVPTLPKVPTTLSAALPGKRTLTFTTRAHTGDVEWTSSAVREPITWTVLGDGKTAKAKGVLPTSGTWSFTATLVKGTAVVVVKGRVTLVG